MIVYDELMVYKDRRFNRFADNVSNMISRRGLPVSATTTIKILYGGRAFSGKLTLMIPTKGRVLSHTVGFTDTLNLKTFLRKKGYPINILKPTFKTSYYNLFVPDSLIKKPTKVVNVVCFITTWISLGKKMKFIDKRRKK